MKLLIDENIGVEIEKSLIEAGHDVARVASGSRNGEIVRLALADARVLLTHDIHFSNILIYPPRKYSGIIRIRIHPPLPEKIIPALRGLLSKFSPEEFIGRLYVLDEDGFRVR